MKSVSNRRVFSCIAVLFGILFVMLFLLPSADAKVTGRCKDCHEMHSDEPLPSLAKGRCLGCHAMKPAGTQNIISLGRAHIPQIVHAMPNGDLAAGNFYYVSDMFTSDYGRGHNVAGISQPENSSMNVPPGFMPNIPIPGGTGPLYWPDKQELNCSGTWGCHGDRTIEDPYRAMTGAHHADDSVIDGSTVGRSFRFLLGVVGVEHPEWEYLATPDNHNGYRGDIDHTSMNTVSYLCGQCHSRFHPNPYLGGAGEVGSAYYNAWVRHPADIAFSTMHTRYIGSEYQDFTRYSLEVPVGYDNPTGKETEVGIDSVVVCVSCHRAHASPYLDTLRWNYNRMESHKGMQGTGCLTCHTRKGDH